MLRLVWNEDVPPASQRRCQAFSRTMTNSQFGNVVKSLARGRALRFFAQKYNLSSQVIQKAMAVDSQGILRAWCSVGGSYVIMIRRRVMTLATFSPRLIEHSVMIRRNASAQLPNEGYQDYLHIPSYGPLSKSIFKEIRPNKPCWDRPFS